MKLKAVFNTDAVNRYGQVFLARTLDDMLREKWRTGTPCNIGHDMTKPAGWAVPVCVYFQPQLTSLVGIIQVPESDSEWDQMLALRRHAILHQQDVRCRPYESELRSRIGQYLTPSAAMVDAGCVAFHDKGLAVRVFPDLFNTRDKDGLISLADLKRAGVGFWDIGGLCVSAHHFFRRSFSLLNTLNTHFISRLQNLATKGTEARIALDEDIVGLSSTYLDPIELEFWWGPKFTDNLSTIETGVTRHGASDFEKRFAGIANTDFWWQSRDKQHILEVEELRDIPVDRAGVEYGCRYVHSIVEEDTSKIIHLDGAIRAYDTEKMLSRIDKKISECGRDTEYTKLWRVDGGLETQDWKALVADYFRDNHLVGEYLGVEDEDYAVHPSTKEDVLPNPTAVQKYVPCGIDKGSGVRISLHYEETSSSQSKHCYVVPLDVLTVDGRSVEVVDLFTLELKKILTRFGGTLVIPSNVGFLACEDLYVSLPLIVHASVKDGSLELTLQAVKKLVEWSTHNGHDRAFIVNVSYPLTDRMLVVSIYGHSMDLLAFLNSSFSHLPRTEAELAIWIDSVAEYLKKSQECDRPLPHDIVQTDGYLRFDHPELPETVQYETKFVEGVGLVYDLVVDAAHMDLADAIQQGDLSLRPCVLVQSVKCSRCSKNFVDCDCSVVLDGAGKIIEKGTAVRLVITDKPA